MYLATKIVKAYYWLKTQCYYPIFFNKIGKSTILINPRRIVSPRNISIGNNTLIEADSELYSIASYAGVLHEGKIEIGNNCYINHSCNISAAGNITIGDDVTIAFNVSIMDSQHSIADIESSYNQQKLEVNPKITIGCGSWLGANSFIMSSVGKRSIIGANSVVTKPIPDYSIAVGNPARVIKRYDFTQNKWVKKPI